MAKEGVWGQSEALETPSQNKISFYNSTHITFFVCKSLYPSLSKCPVNFLINLPPPPRPLCNHHVSIDAVEGTTDDVFQLLDAGHLFYLKMNTVSVMEPSDISGSGQR